MAISVDHSTVAKVIDEDPATGGLSVTTASFTAPASSVLVACAWGDQNSAYSGGVTYSVSNTGTALTWTETNLRDAADAGATQGYAVASVAHNASSQSITVTGSVTPANDNNNRSLIMKVLIITGADTADIVGAIQEGSSTTNNINSTAVTLETSGGCLVGVANCWNALGTPGTSDTEAETYHNGSLGSAITAYEISGTQINFDAFGTSAADWNWIVFEVREAAGGAANPKGPLGHPLHGPFAGPI